METEDASTKFVICGLVILLGLFLSFYIIQNHFQDKCSIEACESIGYNYYKFETWVNHCSNDKENWFAVSIERGYGVFDLFPIKCKATQLTNIPTS